jgi:hypothetical protein
MPDEHAQYSPSALKNFEKCPSFLPSSGSSEAAEKGTRIHEAAELNDMSICANDAEEEMAIQLLEAVERISLELGMDKPDQDIKEVRVKVDLGRVKTFGTCDRLIIKGDRALAIDYKTGISYIEGAATNTQAQAYTLGIFAKFPEIKSVDFYFLIPARNEELKATFIREDIPKLELRIQTIIVRAMETAGEVFNPQPAICKWCGNQGRCEALANTALDIAGKYDKGLDLPDEIHGEDIDDPKVIGKIFKALPSIEAWCKSMRKRTWELGIQEGWDIPGTIKVEKNKARSLGSPAAVWELIKHKGISKEDYLDSCSKVSITKLEELIAAKAERGKKGKAKQELEDELRDAGLMSAQDTYMTIRPDYTNKD